MKRYPPIAAALALLALTGCAPTKTPVDKTWKGPTDPMAQVVADINANNAKVPTLWARHYYEATIVDDKKQSHFVNGNGALLYRGPRGMRLVGKKDPVGTVFEVGSTDEAYWLSIVPEMDTMWWGKYANLGKPCVDRVPIQPNGVLEVLGVGLIETNFAEPPAPVMRFNNDTDSYMFVWVAPAANPSRLVAQK